MTKNKKNLAKTKILIFIFFIFVFLGSLEWSSSSFSLLDGFEILLHELKGEKLSERLITAKTILFEVRLPRVLTAALSGASLGIAGVLSQGLFRNPLASPSLIGTTSGGVLGGILFLSLSGVSTHFLGLSFFSFLGSLLTTSGILFLFHKLRNPDFTKLLLVGLSFSTFTGALCQFVISLEESDYQKSLMIYRWSLGGFYHTEWTHFFLSLFPLSIGIVASFSLCSKLDVLSLGDEVAETMGVALHDLKMKTLLLLSLLVGVVTSLAGPLPFIGLMAPHITRKLIGAKHTELMKYTFFNSMSLILLADLLAKNIFHHKELELGILLSLIGAPFFLYLSLKKEI